MGKGGEGKGKRGRGKILLIETGQINIQYFCRSAKAPVKDWQSVELRRRTIFDQCE